jgi:pyrroloquinoline quinone biosynthesis protein D
MDGAAPRARRIVAAGTRPMLPRHVRLKEDARRGLWLLLAPERVLTPDPIAVEVLQLCDGRRAVTDIAEELARRYAAPAEQIAADVTAMLQDLSDKGFLAEPKEDAG